MKYRVMKYFAAGKFPVGTIIDENQIVNICNIEEKRREGCIEPYFEQKAVQATPENKAIQFVPENKTENIEVKPKRKLTVTN